MQNTHTTNTHTLLKKKTTQYQTHKTNHTRQTNTTHETQNNKNTTLKSLY